MHSCLTAALLVAVADPAGAADQPPPGVETIDFDGPMKPGMVIVTRDPRKASTGGGEVWRSLPDRSAYNGKPAWRLTSGWETDIYDVKTLNKIAIYRGGKPFSSRTPDEQRFLWPLWVGKSYPTTYTYIDHESGQRNDCKGTWTVEAREKLTIPAGTFDTLRMQFEPATCNYRMTLWYERDLGYYVKQVFAPTGGESIIWYIDRVLEPPASDLAMAYAKGLGAVGKVADGFVGTWQAKISGSTARLLVSTVGGDGAAKGSYAWNDKEFIFGKDVEGKVETRAGVPRLSIVWPGGSKYDLLRAGDKVTGTFWLKNRERYTVAVFEKQ